MRRQDNRLLARRRGRAPTYICCHWRAHCGALAGRPGALNPAIACCGEQFARRALTWVPNIDGGQVHVGTLFYEQPQPLYALLARGVAFRVEREHLPDVHGALYGDAVLTSGLDLAAPRRCSRSVIWAAREAPAPCNTLCRPHERSLAKSKDCAIVLLLSFGVQAQLCLHPARQAPVLALAAWQRCALPAHDFECDTSRHTFVASGAPDVLGRAWSQLAAACSSCEIAVRPLLPVITQLGIDLSEGLPLNAWRRPACRRDARPRAWVAARTCSESRSKGHERVACGSTAARRHADGAEELAQYTWQPTGMQASGRHGRV